MSQCWWCLRFVLFFLLKVLWSCVFCSRLYIGNIYISQSNTTYKTIRNIFQRINRCVKNTRNPCLVNMCFFYHHVYPTHATAKAKYIVHPSSLPGGSWSCRPVPEPERNNLCRWKTGLSNQLNKICSTCLESTSWANYISTNYIYIGGGLTFLWTRQENGVEESRGWLLAETSLQTVTHLSLEWQKKIKKITLGL